MHIWWLNEEMGNMKTFYIGDAEINLYREEAYAWYILPCIVFSNAPEAKTLAIVWLRFALSINWGS